MRQILTLIAILGFVLAEFALAGPTKTHENHERHGKGKGKKGSTTNNNGSRKRVLRISPRAANPETQACINALAANNGVSHFNLPDTITNNCNKYIACDSEETTVITILGQSRNCPAGQYFKLSVRTCVPQGSVRCQDPSPDVATTFNEVGEDASAFCFACGANRRNHKDLYGDNTDCHFYYQCFYHNSTYAWGIRRPCPPSQFWSEKLLTCVPESQQQQCVDRCYQSATSINATEASLQCYPAAESGACNSYFFCANSASYPVCCPEGTAFVQETCSCELDATCTDTCVLPDAFQRSTTVIPPTVINADEGICRDSYGNYQRSIVDEPGFFWLYEVQQNTEESNIDFDNGPRIKVACPPGLLFNAETCGCTDLTATTPAAIAPTCLFYAPYDNDANDHNSNKFLGFIYDDTDGTVVQNETVAHGNGSLKLDGQGHVEYPGFKSYSFAANASWCFFYRCPDDGCANAGGLLSNGDGAMPAFSIKATVQGGGALQVDLTFYHPFSQVTLNGAAGAAGAFVQACIVYDGTNATLFINKEQADSKQPSEQFSNIEIGHCPYTVGNDQQAGSFAGFFDEFLVCAKALSVNEVAAHFDGHQALADAGLVNSQGEATTTVTPTTTAETSSPATTTTTTEAPTTTTESASTTESTTESTTTEGTTESTTTEGTTESTTTEGTTESTTTEGTTESTTTEGTTESTTTEGTTESTTTEGTTESTTTEGTTESTTTEGTTESTTTEGTTESTTTEGTTESTTTEGTTESTTTEGTTVSTTTEGTTESTTTEGTTVSTTTEGTTESTTTEGTTESTTTEGTTESTTTEGTTESTTTEGTTESTTTEGTTEPTTTIVAP